MTVDGVIEIPLEKFNTNYNYASLLPKHDIAITDIKIPKNVVGHGFSLNITITIENQGDYDETFDIMLYANMTCIASQTLTLKSRDLIIIKLIWNTTGFTKGNYTVLAHAPQVADEADITDNKLFGGFIIVAMVGDITGITGWPDGRVDMRDVGLVARMFGTYEGRLDYNPNCDINCDGKVDMKDVGIVARNFGKTDP